MAHSFNWTFSCCCMSFHRNLQEKQSLLNTQLLIKKKKKRNLCVLCYFSPLTWWRAPEFANQSVSQQLAGLCQLIVSRMAHIKSCSLWILHKTVAKQQTLHYKRIQKLVFWKVSTAAGVKLKYCVHIREKRHRKDGVIKPACTFHSVFDQMLLCPWMNEHEAIVGKVIYKDRQTRIANESRLPKLNCLNMPH